MENIKSIDYLEYYKGLYKSKHHDFPILIGLLKKHGLPLGILNPNIRNELDYYEYAADDIMDIDFEYILSSDLLKKNEATVALLILMDYGYCFNHLNINKMVGNKNIEYIVVDILLSDKYWDIYRPNYSRIVNNLKKHGFFKDVFIVKALMLSLKIKKKEISIKKFNLRLQSLQDKWWDFKYIIIKKFKVNYNKIKNYVDYVVKVKINGIKNGFVIEDDDILNKIGTAKLKLNKMRNQPFKSSVNKAKDLE